MNKTVTETQKIAAPPVPAGTPWQVIPPQKDMSIEGILARLTAALDEQAKQIEIIKSMFN